MTTPERNRYLTTPLEEMTVTELTDALGLAESAALLDVSARSIYAVRCSNYLGVERIRRLIAAIRKDEAACRERLAVKSTQRAIRARQNAARNAA